MAITLGKAATLTVGTSVASVRDVQWQGSADGFDVEEFGVRANAFFPTRWDAVVSFEINDGADVTLSMLTDGTEVSVSGGQAGWSFTGVVTGIGEGNPLDGVTSWRIEVRMTKAGLR